MSTDGLDIRELLDYLAAHDGRTVDLVAVYAWTEQAVLGGWTREAVRTAAVRHYATVPPVCWPGTDEPRPLLPADINQLISREEHP